MKHIEEFQIARDKAGRLLAFDIEEQLVKNEKYGTWENSSGHYTPRADIMFSNFECESIKWEDPKPTKAILIIGV